MSTAKTNSDPHNFENLKSIRHMLLWVCDEPESAITTELTRLMRSQISGTRLLSFRVDSVPEVICTGKESEDGLLTVSKFGVAIPFTTSVCSPDSPTTLLTGVFTWIIVDVGQPELVKSRFWLDVNGDIATFGREGELLSRLYRFTSTD